MNKFVKILNINPNNAFTIRSISYKRNIRALLLKKYGFWLNTTTYNKNCSILFNSTSSLSKQQITQRPEFLISSCKNNIVQQRQFATLATKMKKENKRTLLLMLARKLKN
ncbi:hypothetical protein DOY81_003651 [Sarcophaga bullata]|nr:hypothetical protein DOY81_003651 [Sarcophaga bullata]